IISKRIIKKATARNYLKRLIREGFRKQQAKMENLDCLILARRGCTLENKIKLRQELATLWQSLLAC
ncbi:MAG TPA: ribonuclease P protein component, partial [Gammaproteobacteria bacterium]|nr:ribonuclease P protein component [Gammaproteobacteria bacterium]